MGQIFSNTFWPHHAYVYKTRAGVNMQHPDAHHAKSAKNKTIC